MGRGKSKARQTKVARNLKYATHEIDIEKLSQELHEEKENLELENKSINNRDSFDSLND
jgi:hypothetical protein